MSKTSCKASSRQVSPGRVVKNETEIPPAGRIVKRECLAVDWSRRGRDSPQSGAASAVLFLPGDRGLLSGAFRRKRAGGGVAGWTSFRSFFAEGPPGGWVGLPLPETPPVRFLGGGGPC